MNSKIIFIAAIAFSLVSCTGNVIPPAPDEQVFCTQDVMQCPDGSSVGRSGPKCEFVCP